MTFAEIMSMVNLFGDRIRFFGVESAAKMAAASICIAINAEVLYIFYWGDAEGMQNHSPVVQLAANIYGHCQKEGFRIMDAGISTDEGEPDHGLIRFKRGLNMRRKLPEYCNLSDEIKTSA